MRLWGLEELYQSLPAHLEVHLQGMSAIAICSDMLQLMGPVSAVHVKARHLEAHVTSLEGLSSSDVSYKVESSESSESSTQFLHIKTIKTEF